MLTNPLLSIQATQDLIKSLHETSLMLQERMVINEHQQQHQTTRHRMVFDEPLVSRPRQFVRSPSKRGVRVSARFKRMTPSPAKMSPSCRKGIRGIKPAAPSPLTSPSQNMTFEKSPGVKRGPDASTADPNLTGSPTKKLRDNDSGVKDSGITSGSGEGVSAPPSKPRRRSDIARRLLASNYKLKV
eukprot:sb/3471359/